MPRTADRSTIIKRFRRWGRWLLWATPFLLVVIGVLAALLWAGHQHTVAQLETATTNLDLTDPGWRLEDIEAARAMIPDEENSGLIAQAAHKGMPAQFPSEQLLSILDAAWLQPLRPLDEERGELLQAELENVATCLEKARELADRPTGRYPIVYQRDVLSTLLTHVQATRTLANLLTLDAVHRADLGDFDGAARSCRAAVNAGRSIGDEPLMISQIVRVADVTIALRGLSRVLSQGETSPEELTRLQQLLESERQFRHFRVSVRGDRALLNRLFDSLENGSVGLHEIGEKSKPSATERFAPFAIHDQVRVAHVRYLTLTAKLLDVADTPPHLRAPGLWEFDAMLQAGGKDLAYLFSSHLGRQEKNFTRFEASLGCHVAALAAERYRLAHGDWPESLEQLVPEMLAAVPLDPYDAAPLRYRRLEDGVVIYSIGADPKEQVFDPDLPSPPGVGVVVRLWDAGLRGKSVPPP